MIRVQQSSDGLRLREQLGLDYGESAGLGPIEVRYIDALGTFLTESKHPSSAEQADPGLADPTKIKPLVKRTPAVGVPKDDQQEVTDAESLAPYVVEIHGVDHTSRLLRGEELAHRLTHERP